MPDAPSLDADAWRLSSEAADEVLARALDGVPRFIEENWRRRYHVSRGACIDLPPYDVDDYLRDLGQVQTGPYLSVQVDQGSRAFGRHRTLEELKKGLADGGVSATKISRSWHGADPPKSWLWMRDLFGALCRAVSMIYLSPQRSEDVDLFLAGPQSGLGCHFDSTDVFTIQLAGERRWRFDLDPDADAVLRETALPDWYPAKEMSFQGETVELVLRPGDALYVPAYCLHQVSGVSWSVGLSLGLRAINEIDVMEHILETIRQIRFSSYGPLPSVPPTTGERHAEVNEEVLARLRALIGLMETSSWAALMNGLRLPPALSGTSGSQGQGAEVSGAFRTGFAVDGEG